MNDEEREPTTEELHDAGINLTPGTTKSDVVAFLYRNTESKYTPPEVSEHLDISHGTAATTLKCLYEARHIGKRETVVTMLLNTAKTSDATSQVLTN